MARPLLAPPPAAPLPPGPRPSFSVIVTAYQVAAYVGEAVRSALEQTRAPLDVVVVDDGSTDDVAGALAPFAERVTLIRQRNQGPGAAKLAGARAARGDFVAFLDGDDWYLPERVEALAEAAAARPDLDILLTDAYVVLDGERIGTVYDETWPFEVADQRRGILERCFVLGHAAARRERLLAIERIDPDALDDWDCWATLILAGARAGLVGEPLSCYRVRAGSYSTRRAGLYRRGAVTLRRLEAEAELSPGERDVLARTRAEWERLHTLEAAREALHGGEGAARPLLARIVRDRGYGWRPRLKALASLLAPALARRLLADRDRREFVGAGGVRAARGAQ